MLRLGLPNVSIAVVQNGRLAEVRAFGAAGTNSRYEIGSVTKQFSAACILLLQQDRKLRLDDRLAKYLPNIHASGLVTLRELLDQTSGYPDYYATLSDPVLFDETTIAHIVVTYGEADIATRARLDHLRRMLDSFGAPVVFLNAQRQRRGAVTISTAYIVMRGKRAYSLTVGDTPAGKITDILLEPR